MNRERSTQKRTRNAERRTQPAWWRGWPAGQLDTLSGVQLLKLVGVGILPQCSRGSSPNKGHQALSKAQRTSQRRAGARVQCKGGKSPFTACMLDPMVDKSKPSCANGWLGERFPQLLRSQVQVQTSLQLSALKLNQRDCKKKTGFAKRTFFFEKVSPAGTLNP